MQEEIKLKRKILKKALSVTLKEFRLSRKKSITLISNEINLSKTIWADIENANCDLQFSTFWRIAEALDIEPETFIYNLRKNLPENFSFLE